MVVFNIPPQTVGKEQYPNHVNVNNIVNIKTKLFYVALYIAMVKYKFSFKMQRINGRARFSAEKKIIF